MVPAQAGAVGARTRGHRRGRRRRPRGEGVRTRRPRRHHPSRALQRMSPLPLRARLGVSAHAEDPLRSRWLCRVPAAAQGQRGFRHVPASRLAFLRAGLLRRAARLCRPGAEPRPCAIAGNGAGHRHRHRRSAQRASSTEPRRQDPGGHRYQRGAPASGAVPGRAATPSTRPTMCRPACGKRRADGWRTW